MAQVTSESSNSVIVDSQSPSTSSSLSKGRKGIDDNGKQKYATNKDTSSRANINPHRSESSNEPASHKYDKMKIQKAISAAERGDRLSAVTAISALDISLGVCAPNRPTVWRSTLNAPGFMNIRQSVAQRGTLDESDEKDDQVVARTTPLCYLQFEYLKSHQVRAYFTETTSGQRVEKEFQVTGSEKHRVELPQVARQVAHKLSDPLSAALKHDPSGLEEAFINATLSGDSQLLITAGPLRSWYSQHEVSFSGSQQREMTKEERQLRKNISQLLTVSCTTSMEICFSVLDEHGMCVSPVRRSGIVQVSVVTRRCVPFGCNSSRNSSAYQADAEDGDKDADTNSRHLSSNVTDPLPDDQVEQVNLTQPQNNGAPAGANTENQQNAINEGESPLGNTFTISPLERNMIGTPLDESDGQDDITRFATESVFRAPPGMRQAFSLPFSSANREHFEKSTLSQLVPSEAALPTELINPLISSNHNSPQLSPASVQSNHVLIPIAEYNALIAASTHTTQTVGLSNECDQAQQQQHAAPLPYHLVRTVVHIDTTKTATNQECDSITRTPSKTKANSQPLLATENTPVRHAAGHRASVPIVIGDEEQSDRGDDDDEDDEDDSDKDEEEYVDASDTLSELAGESVVNPIAVNAESESESETPDEHQDNASSEVGQRVAFASGTCFRTRHDLIREQFDDDERLTRSASASTSARPVTRSATNSLTKLKRNKRDTIYNYEQQGSMKRNAARRCFDSQSNLSNLSANQSTAVNLSQATDGDKTGEVKALLTPAKRGLVQKRRPEATPRADSSSSSSCITSAQVIDLEAPEVVDLDAVADHDIQQEVTESPALPVSRSGQKRRAK